MARVLQNGRRQGLQEGLLEGQRSTLRALLVQRFGQLPAAVESRIAGASAEDLARWTPRVLTATSLAEAIA